MLHKKAAGTNRCLFILNTSFVINLSLKIRRAGEGLLQLIYPPLCISCHQLIRDETPIRLMCSACLNSLQRLSPGYVHQHILRRLLRVHLDELHVGVQFTPVVQVLIHHIKYQHMGHLARDCGSYFRRFLPPMINETESNMVIPVPLHPAREKERGYNQSKQIARGLVSGGKASVIPDLLIRARETTSQTRLNREERRLNVSGAFRIDKPDMVINREVILVDDVVTTGATMNECAAVLKAHGARRVVGVSLATPVNLPADSRQPLNI